MFVFVTNENCTKRNSFVGSKPQNMKKAILLFSLHFLVASICISTKVYGQKPDHWGTAIVASDNWHYHVGISAPSTNWKLTTFDQSVWHTGKGGIGYGDNDDGTTIGTTTSVFIRKEFTVTDHTK